MQSDKRFSDHQLGLLLSAFPDIQKDQEDIRITDILEKFAQGGFDSISNDEATILLNSKRGISSASNIFWNARKETENHMREEGNPISGEFFLAAASSTPSIPKPFRLQKHPLEIMISASTSNLNSGTITVKVSEEQFFDQFEGREIRLWIERSSGEITILHGVFIRNPAMGVYVAEEINDLAAFVAICSDKWFYEIGF